MITTERQELAIQRKHFIESIVLAVRRTGGIIVTRSDELDWHPTPMQEACRIMREGLSRPGVTVQDPPPETVYHDLSEECRNRGWELSEGPYDLRVIAPFKRRECWLCDGAGRIMKPFQIRSSKYFDPSEMMVNYICPKCNRKGYREDRIEDPPWTKEDHEVITKFLMSLKPWEFNPGQNDEDVLKKAWRWKLKQNGTERDASPAAAVLEDGDK